MIPRDGMHVRAEVATSESPMFESCTAHVIAVAPFCWGLRERIWYGKEFDVLHGLRFKLILKPQALNPKLQNRWSKLLQEKGVIAQKNPKPTSFRGASWRCSVFDLLIPLRVVGSTKLHREPEALRALPKLNKQPDN